MTYIAAPLRLEAIKAQYRSSGFLGFPPLKLRSKLLISASLILFVLGSAVSAANECGPDAPGQGTNVCTNLTYNALAGASAIEYLSSDGLTLDFQNTATLLTSRGGSPVNGLNMAGINTLAVNATGLTIERFSRGIAISHTGGGGAINLNIVDTNVDTTASTRNGQYGALAFAGPTSTADVSLVATDSSFRVAGTSSNGGLSAQQAGLSGNVSVELNNVVIETLSPSSPGALSIIRNTGSTGNASLVMNGGSVLTGQAGSGLGSGGIQALNLGLGDATVEFNGGDIETRGVGSGRPPGNVLNAGKQGVRASVGLDPVSAGGQFNTSSTATATARMNGGTISTGNMIFANGLEASNFASGAAQAFMTGGQIDTFGPSSSGVLAAIKSGQPTTALVSASVINGTVTSNGPSSVAVGAFNSGDGDAIVDVSGGSTLLSTGSDGAGITARSTGATIVRVLDAGTTVTATGVSSSGIWVRQGASGAGSTFDVFVDTGVIVTGGTGPDSAGIEIDSQLGNTGTIDIASGAVIDGTPGLAGIWDGAGDATITSEGDVRGGILTEAGNDVVNLIAGSTTSGGIDTGEDDDAVNIGSATTGSFATVSGGILTGDGADTVLISAGSLVTGGLDLGADDDSVVISGATGSLGSLAGGIDAGDGADTVLISAGGLVTGGLDLGTGDDSFVISGATGLLGSLTGGINAGTGDDAGEIRNDAVVAGDILMSDGSDSLIIQGGADISGVTAIDGGDDTSPSDGQEDILGFDGGVRSFAGGDLLNWETIELAGGADLTFSGSPLVTGSAVGSNSFGPPYGLVVTSGASARFDGDFEVDGNLNNSGTVDLSLDALEGTVLDVSSNYVGTAGSSLLIDVFLNDGGTDNVASNDSNISDQILIRGNASGQTAVFVTNLTGLGDYTDRNSNDAVENDEGILFAQVEGASSATLFTLGGPVTVGAFTYDLVVFDPTTSQSGFWDYILANRFSNSSQSYETYPRAVMFTMPTLHQRVGNRHWTGVSQPEVAAVEIFCKEPDQNYRCTITEEQAAYYHDTIVIEDEDSGWVRVVGSQSSINPTFSTSNAVYDVDTFEIQVGLDRLIRENDNGSKWIGGINAQISQSFLTGTDPNGVASMDATGVGVGGSATYYRPNGFYTDLQARAMVLSTDFSSTDVSTGSYDNARSTVLSASAEVGRKFQLGNDWQIIPQAQIAYSQARFRPFTDSVGAVVEPEDAESLSARVGVVVGRERSWQADDGTTRRLEVEAGIHVHQELIGTQTTVNVSGTPLYNEIAETTAEITLGATYNWNDDKSSIYGEVGVQSGLRGFSESRRVAGTIGFRTRWD